MKADHSGSARTVIPNDGQRRNVLVTMAGLFCATSAFSGCGGGGGDEGAAVTPTSGGSPTHKSAPAPAAGLTSAAAIVADMGSGFNLGNTFDLGQHSTEPAAIFPLIDLYQAAGMRHVRIPVTWMEPVAGSTLAAASGLVNAAHPRLAQLKAVVDYALSKNLYVVLNAHHERGLYQRYDGSPALDAAFSTLWQGIAEQFADRSPKLIFEVLNEPQGVFGDWSGGASPSDSRALALTRRINKLGYEAIRASGGPNAQRLVMVGTNGMGNHAQLRVVYPTKADLPGGGSDRFLAAQVHTYDPWPFCGQDGSNAAWPGDLVIAGALLAVMAHAATLGLPVNYGEFGVGRDTQPIERDSDVVRGYYRLVNRTVLNAGMSSTVWDDRGWFGLVAANGTGGFAFVNRIVPAMLAG